MNIGNILTTTSDVLKHLLFTRRQRIPSSKENKKKKAHNLSKEKREHINSLISQLLENDAVVNSGKIQLINFERIKDYMGSRWQIVEAIVCGITEDVIKKYTEPGDISLRYQDDNYIIVFARADFEESSLKCQLMASEIQRLIFETEQQHEALKGLSAAFAVTSTHSVVLQDQKDPLEYINQSLDVEISFIPHQKDGNFKSNSKRVTFIGTPGSEKEDEKSDERTEEEQEILEKYLEFLIMPLLDSKTATVKAAICIANDTRNIYPDAQTPLQKYHALFLGLSSRLKSYYDLRILKKSIELLQESREAGYNRTIKCPVHFETLSADVFSNEYLMLSRKISQEDSKHFSFIVLGIPNDVPRTTLDRIIQPLRYHDTGLTAMLPVSLRVSLPELINNGFTGVCAQILNRDAETNYGASFVRDFLTFTEKAQALSLRTTILLENASSFLIGSAKNTNFDFIGGEAIQPAQKIDMNVKKGKRVASIWKT